MTTLTIPPYFQSSSLQFISKVQFDVRHLVSCSNVLVLTWSVFRTRQSAPSWKRHIHINGTIYYSLEIQGQNRLFRRAITEEDITDPDVQRAMEDGCDEYHQWLEEADLDDLPDDLELLIHSIIPTAESRLRASYPITRRSDSRAVRWRRRTRSSPLHPHRIS